VQKYSCWGINAEIAPRKIYQAYLALDERTKKIATKE